jgi:hypothetical protein
MKEEIEKNIVPDHVVAHFLTKHNDYPCIIKTRNITLDGVVKLYEKNKLCWYNAEFDGTQMNYLQGLIQYGKNKIMIYFERVHNENVYKLKILNTLENIEIVYLLLKGINRYYTIDKL